LAEGTRVNLTVARGAADNSQHARAVFEAGGVNINRELIDIRPVQEGYLYMTRTLSPA
jgi:hypothetical protein